MHHTTATALDACIEKEPATEVLLSQVATALLRLPFDSRTRGLHLRALALKHRLEKSGQAMPNDHERRAIREGILVLRSEAAAWLALVR